MPLDEANYHTMVDFFLLRLFGVLRRTWVVVVITVVSCAAFAARAASALVAADLFDAARPAARPASRPDGAAPPRPLPARLRGGDGRQLVERDMFCSSCAPADRPQLVLASALLIETSLGDEPRATLRVLASEVQGSWGVGDHVPGLGRLDQIAPTWIELVDGAGHRGRLSLREPAAGDDPVTAMTKGPPAATPWAGRFKKIDDQTYEVDRDLVRELVTDVAKLGGARFLPIIERGELQGVRLLGVGPKTLLFELGLQSRDQLVAINGAPIKTAQQLIDLYASIDQMSTVELSGMRGSKPLVRTLRLR